MPLTTKEFLAVFETAQHQEWDKTKISIMVFGPNTEGKKIGSSLRKYIIEKCNEYGVVIRTEHEDFTDIHREILGSGRSLCTMELTVARHVDAIVMIPDSEGSLVELGMFAPYREFHEKTLILYRDKYSSPAAQLSFVYLGPTLAYKASNAPIEFLDYRRKELAWQKVKAFLHNKRADKYERSNLKKLVS